MYNVKGYIQQIKNVKVVSDRFRKREFVIKTEHGQEAEYIKMELHQDRCDKIDTFNLHDQVQVGFQLRGNQKYKGEAQGFIYYTHIVAIDIRKI